MMPSRIALPAVLAGRSTLNPIDCLMALIGLWAAGPPTSPGLRPCHDGGGAGDCERNN